METTKIWETNKNRENGSSRTNGYGDSHVEELVRYGTWLEVVIYREKLAFIKIEGVLGTMKQTFRALSRR